MIRDDDILRLDIPMDNAMGVGVGEPFKHLEEQSDSQMERDSAPRQDRAERLPADQFHDQRQAIRRRERGVDGGDIGVLEAGLDLDLPEETLLILIDVEVAIDEHFDGVAAARDYVFGFKYLARGSGADPGQDPVLSKLGSCFKAHADP